AKAPGPRLRLSPRPVHPVDALPRHAPQAGPGGRPVPRRLVLGHGLPHRCRARARGAHSPLEPGNAAPGLRTAAGPRALARRAARGTDPGPRGLHHLRRDSPQPERRATFYSELLGDRVERLGEDAWLLAGRHRRLVIGRGTAGAVPYFALQMQDASQLREYAR